MQLTHYMHQLKTVYKNIYKIIFENKKILNYFFYCDDIASIALFTILYFTIASSAS